MVVAECHDVDVLRQSAFPKNKRASAQNSAFASNTSLRPFNGKANYLRTSTHRAKIRIKHNTKSFSCRDRPMIMNSIEGCNLCVYLESYSECLNFPTFPIDTLPASQRLQFPVFNYSGPGEAAMMIK